MSGKIVTFVCIFRENKRKEEEKRKVKENHRGHRERTERKSCYEPLNPIPSPSPTMRKGIGLRGVEGCGFMGRRFFLDPRVTIQVAGRSSAWSLGSLG
jgi:hypothetical protein